MRSVLIILCLLFCAEAYSQNYFEIEPKPVFGDTVTWIGLSDAIHVNLGQGTATWQVEGLKVVHTDSLGNNFFKPLIKKKVTVPYSGQPITRNGQKNASATEFNLVYLGSEQ